MFGLDGPRMPPRSGKPAKLVILAHGYGSNGQDLMGLAPFFSRELPDAVFVSPNAPDPVPGYAGGYQWFPLTRLDPPATLAGVRAAGPVLDRFIDAELLRYGLPASACALVGFSQGTMMALHVGLRRAEPLGAILGFSGHLAGPELLPTEARSRPPVCLIHGDQDDVIPAGSMLAAVHGMADARIPSMWKISRGAGHTIAEDGLAVGGRFLKQALAGRYAAWAPPGRKIAPS
jgi:phospholipase/carboxylesterase